MTLEREIEAKMYKNLIHLFIIFILCVLLCNATAQKVRGTHEKPEKHTFNPDDLCFVRYVNTTKI